MKDAEERSREVGLLLACGKKEERLNLLAQLFVGHRERLHTMVRLRLDGRLRARLSTSDVLQEAYLEVQKRLEQYLHAPPMPFYLWLRRITAQKLFELQRFHLGLQKRAADREVADDGGGVASTTSEGLSLALVGSGPSPSDAAARDELRARLEAALEQMEPADREVVALRHFEQLSGPETAEILGIGVEAARKRYLRAMEKLKKVLMSVPGMPWEL